jgi:hypothetical protein
MYYTMFLTFVSCIIMPLELTNADLKQLKDNNQQKFQDLILAANKLAVQWMETGFDPRTIIDTYDQAKKDKLKQQFFASDYFKYVTELFFALSKNLNDSDNVVYQLFVGSFDYDLESVSFNTAHLALFLNQQIHKHVNGLSFDFIEPVVLEKQLNTSMNEQLNWDCPKTLNEDSPSDSSNHPFRDLLSGIGLQIFGGFLSVMGAAAVAVAFVVLNACTFGVPGLVLASLGAASLLTGVGFFVAGRTKNSYLMENLQSNEFNGLAPN